jgi:hypothetical protein
MKHMKEGEREIKLRHVDDHNKVGSCRTVERSHSRPETSLEFHPRERVTWIVASLLHIYYSIFLTLMTDSVAVVRERTIPTERPPLAGEVSANFCG